MSKHKHFHQIKNPRQMLQHGLREGIGPLCHPASKFPSALGKKETPASSAKADGGKGTQHDH